MKNKQEIKQFIAKIVDRNYKEANASLQKMVETKIKQRIANAVSQKNN